MHLYLARPDQLSYWLSMFMWEARSEVERILPSKHLLHFRWYCSIGSEQTPTPIMVQERTLVWKKKVTWQSLSSNTSGTKIFNAGGLIHC